ncbi:aspartate aminotransferase family protein [Falsochrobactrum shanghaiense]|uniref:Aspartate aminotransferase family protein n=1 Tax=Falsochrobactrum shanghaiense TaxID=2201899 RepID=A0A316J3A4_9HYPH|nr:aminotransferase class III-fold pyridoxal phosphate-dependent enzyme [Falsochrobactrum shanghaiense]PWL16412.1 aspartate aminotransferase family protein [Falsochrobactrum shanghaiense]
MTGTLVERDSLAFFHQEGSSPCQSALRSVGGIWLEEMDGHRLVDLHGNTAHHIGYAHPVLVEALKAQIDELPFSPRRFTNQPAVELAEKLLGHWPGPVAKVLFANSGSDAIEIALKLARVATGRHETISLRGSYHGHGFGAFGLSACDTDERLGPLLAGRHHVTPYWAAGGGERMLAEIEEILSNSQSGIACVIAEPIRSNCHIPPDGLWAEVRRLCDRYGALLIFDEIPSGLGKTGKFFAFEHVGAVPDAVVLGKALGGAMLPIAAVIADARLNIAPELNLGHYTHEKNPLTTRAALTTLEIIESDNLVDWAARAGEDFTRMVAEIAQAVPAIVGSRGKGLLQAIELDPSALGFDADEKFARTLLAELRRQGVSTVFKGKSSISFSPPLVITAAELDDTLKRIRRGVENLRV